MIHQPFALPYSRDLCLAASLYALGIPPHPDVSHINDATGKTVFFFAEQDPQGKYDTSELIRCYFDETWLADNPEHPLAYMAAAFSNRESLMDVVKQSAPLATLHKGSYKVYLPVNASDETRNKALSFFSKGGRS